MVGVMVGAMVMGQLGKGGEMLEFTKVFSGSGTFVMKFCKFGV